MELGLTDYQCCWCQRTVHTECLPEVEEVRILSKKKKKCPVL